LNTQTQGIVKEGFSVKTPSPLVTDILFLFPLEYRRTLKGMGFRGK